MTNEQLKQEAIKNAYGEYWEILPNKDKVLIRGCIEINTYLNLELKFDKVFLTENLVRPKSLSGIETNNGWIRIKEDGSNLPKESGDYWFYTKHKQVLIRDYNPGFNLYESYLNTYTHYQPIVKPLLPIY